MTFYPPTNQHYAFPRITKIICVMGHKLLSASAAAAALRIFHCERALTYANRGCASGILSENKDNFNYI